MKGSQFALFGAIGGLMLSGCILSVILLLRSSPASPAPALAVAPVQAVATPPVPETAWAAVSRKLAAAQPVTPTECLDATDVIPDVYDASWWPIFECIGRDTALRPQIHGLILRAALQMHVLSLPLPAAHRALVDEALAHAKEEPTMLTGQSLQGELADVTREQVEGAITTLGIYVEVCPSCGESRAVRDVQRRLRERLDALPLPLETVGELQLRYADLRNRPVEIVGAVVADTYYNCAYRSTSTWRGMRFAQDLRGLPRMNVYCRRGEPNCDATYEVAIRNNGLVGTAILKYPSSNRICEQSQAELVHFTPR